MANVPDQQQGFSLLEVLIAWTISSCIMLGILLFTNDNLRNTHHRYLQTLALSSLQNMLERLRVNHSVAARQHELALWNQDNQFLLPAGYGECQCNEHSHNCRLTIFWQEHERQQLQIAALI